MPHRLRLYLAARDHLEQADAILANADAATTATIDLRAMIRYVAAQLSERASGAVAESATIVEFAGHLQRTGKSIGGLTRHNVSDRSRDLTGE